MKQSVKTIIDLSGIDLNALAPDNCREVTKAAGKNPGTSELDTKGRPSKTFNIPRGYRLRIPKDFARRTEGTETNQKLGDGGGKVMTRDEARWARLREIIAEFRASQTQNVIDPQPEAASNV